MYSCMLDVNLMIKVVTLSLSEVVASSYLYLMGLRLISGGLKLSRLAQSRGI